MTGQRHIYIHTPHPHIEHRRRQGPVKTAAQAERGNGFARFNSKLGLLITTAVGTMLAAYIFTAIALISLPSAIASHNLTIIIAWLSSNLLQLVLLPVVIVGQNLQARAADARSEQTFKDAESILHECLSLQAHLQAQDQVLEHLMRSGRL